mgnify:CR=1 FL=1
MYDMHIGNKDIPVAFIRPRSRQRIRPVQGSSGRQQALGGIIF